jgi:hypothetical protein
VVDLTEEQENTLVEQGTVEDLTYRPNAGPINVKVVDPLNVPDAEFQLRLKTDSGTSDLDSAYWTLKNLNTGKVITSDKTIAVRNEQLIPDWGISVTITQYTDLAKGCQSGGSRVVPDVLGASIEYEDTQKPWLTGIQDGEGNSPTNWILAGNSTDAFNSCQQDYTKSIDGELLALDGTEAFETMNQGTWAPFQLASTCNNHPATSTVNKGCNHPVDLKELRSVDIVFTDDKSKWTRCPVVELQSSSSLAEGNAEKLHLRAQQSVNKNGEPDNSGTTGMGWFPGYAIDVETGERLNMAFGEDSWLAGQNGADMQWNPTSRLFSDNGLDTLFGGKHYVYVFGSNTDNASFSDPVPAYDKGQWLRNKMTGGPGDYYEAWGQCMWVGAPLLRDGEELLSTDVKVRLRVATQYEKYQTGNDNENDLNPMYGFSTSDVATDNNMNAVLKEEVLDTINVVPNPYYAYSNYEGSRLDNRIKIINLPERATIKIYDISGTLIRTLNKDNPSTEVEWDLRNEHRIPISGGMYLIHVNVPNVGSTTLKWFGAMRPADLENF